MLHMPMHPTTCIPVIRHRGMNPTEFKGFIYRTCIAINVSWVVFVIHISGDWDSAESVYAAPTMMHLNITHVYVSHHMSTMYPK